MGCERATDSRSRCDVGPYNFASENVLTSFPKVSSQSLGQVSAPSLVSEPLFSGNSGSLTVIILGAFVQRYLNWRWIFWIQLIVGGLAQALHFFIVPETRSTVLLKNAAKKLREEGREKEADAVGAPKPALDPQHVLTVWSRPVCTPFVWSRLESN